MAHTFGPEVDHYRVYNDDGGEAASTPKAAEDTAASVDVTAGDAAFQYRVMIEEKNGVSGATTDNWNIQYSKNSGSFIDITNASSNVQVNSASGLTDGSATTNRATNGLTDGAGTFQAGVQKDTTNTIISNYQLLGNQFTEHMFGLKLIAADLADGDTIDIRVRLNAGAPGLPNNVIGRINVTKTDTTATEFSGTLSKGQQKPRFDPPRVVSY